MQWRSDWMIPRPGESFSSPSTETFLFWCSSCSDSGEIKGSQTWIITLKSWRFWGTVLTNAALLDYPVPSRTSWCLPRKAAVILWPPVPPNSLTKIIHVSESTWTSHYRWWYFIWLLNSYQWLFILNVGCRFLHLVGKWIYLRLHSGSSRLLSLGNVQPLVVFDRKVYSVNW